MSEPVESNLRKWGSLVILSLALAIIIIDTTLLNVSLATIIRDLKTNLQSIQWVITGYSLTLAALTITGGRWRFIWSPPYVRSGSYYFCYRFFCYFY